MRYFFVILFLPITVFSQQHYNVKIEGKDSISSKIAKKMRYNESYFDTSSIIKTIKELTENIRNEGYLTANIDLLEKDSNAYIYSLVLGEKFEKGKISIADIPINARIYANLKSKKEYTNILDFIKKRENIITYFENNGYPFASINLDSISILKNGVTAVAKIEKSHLYKIISLNISGYESINEHFILSQIGLKIGQIYDESLIKNISKAINELPFIEIVGKPQILFKENNTVEIKCELRKKSANRFDGLIGFAPDPKNNYKTVITGKIAFELNNKLNKGELINLDWQKLDLYSQKLTAGYNIKYLMKSKFGSESNILLLKQDTTYTNTNIFTAVPYYFTYNKLLKIFYEQKTSILLAKSIIQNATTLPDFADVKKNSLGFGVKLWNLDYSYNPRKGYIFEFQGGSGIKTIDKNPLANQNIYKNVILKTQHLELKGTFSLYVPLSKRTVLLFENKAALMQSSSIFTNELYKIGGAKSLRGFDENAIPCSQYSIANFEYRFLFQKSSNIFCFFNGAYYDNKAANKHIHDKPYGFGLGLNIQNKSNIFTISYAYGSQFGNPIAFNAAKIHFGYLTVF